MACSILIRRVIGSGGSAIELNPFSDYFVGFAFVGLRIDQVQFDLGSDGTANELDAFNQGPIAHGSSVYLVHEPTGREAGSFGG
jgi:hypothetical protein